MIKFNNIIIFYVILQLYDLLCGQAVPSRIKQIPYTR